jgi:radical SAM protein with 4Fe4S-binding SPASM domain
MGALTLSLDGLEDSHNWLRNKANSFERVDRAIKLAAGSPRLNFDVVTCVNKKNIHELPRVYEYLVQRDVKVWRLFTIAPIGRAAKNQDLFLSPVQYKQMLDFIVEKRACNQMDVKYSCEGYVGSYELKVRDGFFYCRAGINIGSILIDGSISACPNIDRFFAQGNISNDNFFEVWQTKFQKFRDRSWTRTGKCSDCNDYRHCQGNGFHLWHGTRQDVLVCHKELIEQTGDN